MQQVIGQLHTLDFQVNNKENQRHWELFPTWESRGSGNIWSSFCGKWVVDRSRSFPCRRLVYRSWCMHWWTRIESDYKKHRQMSQQLISNRFCLQYLRFGFAVCFTAHADAKMEERKSIFDKCWKRSRGAGASLIEVRKDKKNFQPSDVTFGVADLVE